MRRLLLLAAVAAAAAGCVSVEGLPDPRGALKPRQRVVVAVYPSPGPWIVGSSDTKAEAAAKISPLGFFVQTAEDEHTLSVSKNLQQYLPRPHLALAVQESLLTALRSSRSTGTVQTAVEAGIPTAQLAEWNKSKDQLDWRQRYYAPDPDQPAPRDYAKTLTLDDAIVLDVNVSFGTDATDDGRLLPTMSAAVRAYRGDTSKLLWEHEDVAADQSSSYTMTDFQVQPWMLTDSLTKLAPALGASIASSFLKAFIVAPSTSAAHAAHEASASTGGGGGGLVDMSVFQHMSTAASSGLPPTMPPPAAVTPSTSAALTPPVAPAGETAAAPAISSNTATAVSISSAAAAAPAAPPPAPSAAPPLPGLAPSSAATPALSTPGVSLSTPAVQVSTSP